MPAGVRELLRDVCVGNDDDASWNLWSQEAEASLTRAYQTVGGPALLVEGAYLCAQGGLGSADPYDVANAGFFINSSLSPILRFRRRMKGDAMS